MIKELTENGYYYPLDILTKDESNTLYNTILDLHKTNNIKKYQSFLYYKWFYDLCFHEKLVELFKTIVGENPVLWNTAIFIKDPYDQKEMFDHQDSIYDGVITDEKYTIYLALSTNNIETGSLYFYKKSHLNGDLKHIEENDPNNMHGAKLKISSNMNEYEKNYVHLNPGQASVHHMQLVHGSHKNLSDSYRISIGFRITNSSATFTNTKNYSIIYNEKLNLNLINYKFESDENKRQSIMDDYSTNFYKDYVRNKDSNLT